MTRVGQRSLLSASSAQVHLSFSLCFIVNITAIHLDIGGAIRNDASTTAPEAQELLAQSGTSLWSSESSYNFDLAVYICIQASFRRCGTEAISLAPFQVRRTVTYEVSLMRGGLDDQVDLGAGSILR